MRKAAVAIITRDFLSYVRVLADSYLAHHPDDRFFVLSLDGLPDSSAIHPKAEVLRPEDLDLPYYSEMEQHYRPLQLCCALKPSAVRAVLRRTDVDAVIYLDADVMVFQPFSSIESALSDADIVLTPHVLHPIGDDGRRPDELDVLRGGVYNMGFFAVRRSEEGERFLRWWEGRLRDQCRIDVPLGLFLDQRWVDLVPAYFLSVHVLRDETCNVAPWNLGERTLAIANDGSFTVNGRPLTFFHFSSVHLARRSFRTDWRNRVEPEPGSAVLALLETYLQRNIAAGWQERLTRPVPKKATARARLVSAARKVRRLLREIRDAR